MPSEVDQHLGVYAIVPRADRVLVVRKARGPYTGLYDLPGGTPEPAESLAAALVREVREETGYALGSAQQVAVEDVIVLWRHDGFSHLHDVAILYRGSISESGAAPPKGDSGGNDSAGFAWVKTGALCADTASPIAMAGVRWLEQHEPEVWDVTVQFAASEDDREWLRRLWLETWGSTTMVTRGTERDLASAEAYIAWHEHRPVGAVAVDCASPEAELLSLDAVESRHGVGTALLRAAEDAARRRGCRHMVVITSNDNLTALRFYQRRGYRMTGIGADVIDAARLLKPAIPALGDHGIPLHDEVELRKTL